MQGFYMDTFIKTLCINKMYNIHMHTGLMKVVDAYYSVPEDIYKQKELLIIKNVYFYELVEKNINTCIFFFFFNKQYGLLKSYLRIIHV